MSILKVFRGPRAHTRARARMRIAGALIGATAMVGLTACSGASDARSTGGTADGSTSADLAYVKQQLDSYTSVPQFEALGSAFDASRVAGKSMMNIPFSSSVSYNQTLNNAMESVAKRYGIDYTFFQSQGSQADFVAGINQAVSKKVDAINLSTIDPRVLGPQLQAAQDAGITVSSSMEFGPTQMSLIPSTVPVVIPFEWETVARLMADWTIHDTSGKANVVAVVSSDQPSSQPMVDALEDEFKVRCGDSCNLTIVDVPATQWATRIQSAVQSELVKDPSINYVIPIYDGMTQWVVPAIKAANRVGKVHIATENGQPFVLKMMQDEDIIRMDVGQGLEWTGWAVMDQIMRSMAGVPTLGKQSIPLRVFTRDNVSEAGTPPTIEKGYGNSYIDGFTSLWSGK
ncbi:sugar ABC transporter substrate-binding protein [Rhodococcus koreensis]|uniref:sugar ABC transporter substrate-binding protein n=1 Tax=Rhodococcus koreensis TaxID=99653 RepID=UPI00366D1689